jgi:hypothetical protein
MDDDDYSAYLKKQSYSDLLAISCSIDKESQAKRYAMVLAEIAERDRRGEKAQGLDEFKKDGLEFKRILCVIAASVFAITAAVSLYTGHARTKYGHDISVNDNPTSYWVQVGFQILFAVLLVYGALKRDKNKI